MSSYHHGNLKTELLSCAYKMCERDGYTKLSIRSLAKESNVSQTAPYRHFKTKEDLYAEVAAEGFNRLYKAMSKSKYKSPKKNLKNTTKNKEKTVILGPGPPWASPMLFCVIFTEAMSI